MATDATRAAKVLKRVGSSDITSALSRGSAISSSTYRFTHLKNSGIDIRHGYPPTEIKDLLNVIFDNQTKMPERRAKLSQIAKEAAKTFSRLTSGPYREDEYLEAVHVMFTKMFPDDERFSHPQKAGTLLLCEI